MRRLVIIALALVALGVLVLAWRSRAAAGPPAVGAVPAMAMAMPAASPSTPAAKVVGALVPSPPLVPMRALVPAPMPPGVSPPPVTVVRAATTVATPPVGRGFVRRRGANGEDNGGGIAVDPPGAANDLTAWGPPAAPNVDPRRFTEAHWQGLEVIPKSPLVAKALGLSTAAKGVIVDDVTLPADLQGFVAGDLVTHVGSTPTPDLTSFIRASDAVRGLGRIDLWIVRDGQQRVLQLVALTGRLGVANGETPSMIPPGARMPHPFRGPCTNCHRIGTTGTLPVDQGDMLTTTAPTIRVGARRPHRDRGPCAACHRIVP